MSKMDMTVFSEFAASEFFDVPQVEVKGGLAQSGRRPRNRFFLWRDPKGQRDILVLLGEGQPSVDIYAFCGQIIAYALAGVLPHVIHDRLSDANRALQDLKDDRISGTGILMMAQ